MQIVTVDFETYYDKDFSLSKITTEEYIRDPRFEVIGVAVKVGDYPTDWITGNHATIRKSLHSIDWSDKAVLAHNTMFDGAILSWLFGVRPKVLLDTLCMARAVHGVEAGGSLKVLAERYRLGEKGVEVLNALGKRRLDFTEEELSRYGQYCINDVELTYSLFNILAQKFPKQELKVIDATLRMFTEPVLELDIPMLEQHLKDVKDKKESLLAMAAADRDTLMSNDKFAELLKELGVNPPTKTSPRTQKLTWAFAKTDEEFKELLEHPDPRVQALVSARLGTKTTLEETRTQRFIDIGTRGSMPVPLRYYAAHTGRWGGDDKINLQNLPSRGTNGNKLKLSICAPEEHVIIDSDSSQIEARVLAWLAGQDDLVDAFANGEDVYRIMASSIYNKPVEEVSKDERFVGKTTILGAGYGMGAAKFQAQLKNFGVAIELEEAQRIISVYRQTYPHIPALWKQAQTCLGSIVTKSFSTLGRKGVLEFDPEQSGFLLPNGLWQRYDGLAKVVDADGKEQYQYPTRKGTVKIYGGKVIENLCQALARCIIAEQLVKINKHYRVVLTVHDAVACIAKQTEAEKVKMYVEACMREAPSWAIGLPLNCEAGVGKRYGEC
jgi:DNA polymerase